MSIIALPTIFINSSGQRITEENRDPMSVSVTSLGNNGFSEEEEARQKRECVQTAVNNCNVTMIRACTRAAFCANMAVPHA